MFVPTYFHRVNIVVCFLLGSLSNGALIYLVSKHTEEEMRPFRPILLLTTLTDLAHLGVCLVVVPVVAIDNGLAAVFSLGPLAWLPQPYNFVLVSVWIFFVMFSLYSLWVPFVYRYAVIVREKQWGLREFLTLLLVPVLLGGGHVAIFTYAGYTRTEEEQQRGREFFNFTANETAVGVHVLPYFTPDQAHSDLIPLYTMANLAIDYTLVFTFGYRIYRHVAGMAGNLSMERARELIGQLSRTLLLQALIPLFVQIMPTLQLCLSAVTGVHMGNQSVYVTGILAWISVANPLVAMWVVKAYRRQVRNWLRLDKALGFSSTAAAVRSTMLVSQQVPASSTMQQQQKQRWAIAANAARGGGGGGGVKRG